MELNTVQTDRDLARRAFLAYRLQVRRARELEYDEAHQRRLEHLSQADRDARAQRDRDDEALMRAYRHASLGAKIISLTEVIVSAGLGKDRRPLLAIARADQTLIKLAWNGATALFQPANRPARPAASKEFSVRGPEDWRRRNTEGWSRPIADVPAVPAHLRPGHDLSNYATLFEASWRETNTRRRVGDPALLKPLGGDLYAVLAVWDLTPLERAVLGIGPA